MIMGAFSTTRHFDQMADLIAAAGGGSLFEVLTYDHRGIGKSVARDKLESQTSEMLAAEALALVSHVWTGGGRLHVYGASMGGMVAQRLATLLLRSAGARPGPPGPSATSSSQTAAAGPPIRLRLSSLCLVVTARSYGMARFFPMSAGVMRLFLPCALASKPAAMIDSILPKCFSAAFRDTRHPRSPAGETMGALWRQRWVDEYDQWFSFANVPATAAQSTVAVRHFLTDGDAALIVASGVPVLMSIAERDELMAPAAQRELARVLHARTHVSSGGHIGSAEEYFGLRNCIVAHLLAALTSDAGATQSSALASIAPPTAVSA